MKIFIDPQADILLRAWTMATKNEFSGLCDIEKKGDEIWVSSPYVLDVGTFGYTEIDPDKRLLLPPSNLRRGWFHRHPITGWSGTDMHTMTRTPCGTLPEMIQWAVAIVWTPIGWKGALDIFVPQHSHFDLQVVSSFPGDTILPQAMTYMVDNQLEKLAVKYRKDFDKRMSKRWVPDEAAPEPDRHFTPALAGPEKPHNQLEFWETEGIDDGAETVTLEPAFSWHCPECDETNLEEDDLVSNVRCSFCGGYFEVERVEA